eukprot:g5090.t1
MAFALTRAVGRLRLVSTAPRLLQSMTPRVQCKPHFSFSSTLFGQPLFHQEAGRSIGHVVYAGQTKVRCSKSVEKRHRQSEKRRVVNRARKNEIKTRMKKVLKQLDQFKKELPKEEAELDPISPFISAAFKAIDKAVKKGTIHRNTGARRKSRLTRARQRVLINAGLAKPPEKEKVPSLVEQYEAREQVRRDALAQTIAEKAEQT